MNIIVPARLLKGFLGRFAMALLGLVFISDFMHMFWHIVKTFSFTILTEFKEVSEVIRTKLFE